jgi:hypothetical protein
VTCARCGAAPTAGTSSGNALTATASEKKPFRQLSHQTAGTAFPQIPKITNRSYPLDRTLYILKIGYSKNHFHLAPGNMLLEQCVRHSSLDEDPIQKWNLISGVN